MKQVGTSIIISPRIARFSNKMFTPSASDFVFRPQFLAQQPALASPDLKLKCSASTRDQHGNPCCATFCPIVEGEYNSGVLMLESGGEEGAI
ncbi:MAG TPA: hypothetical protein VLA12_09590 [Planctomycetaceae bacterium]|nr:hypothetical protein [Planctomycetaceae bacterium]